MRKKTGIVVYELLLCSYRWYIGILQCDELVDFHFLYHTVVRNRTGTTFLSYPLRSLNALAELYLWSYFVKRINSNTLNPCKHVLILSQTTNFRLFQEFADDILKYDEI